MPKLEIIDIKDVELLIRYNSGSSSDTKAIVLVIDTRQLNYTASIALTTAIQGLCQSRSLISLELIDKKQDSKTIVRIAI